MLGSSLVALMLAAALNPLVVRLPEPQGNIPADCEVSGRPAVARPRIADTPPEEAAPLPAVRPATPRKVDPAELDRAIANNDRAAFDAALASAREAGTATRKHEDIARLWNAQFESPFFSQDSEAYRIASSYPGYEDAMRRYVFTDASGRKFYPAAESRAFVAGRSLPSRRAASASPRTAAPAPSRATSTTPRRPPSRPRVASTRTKSRQPAASRVSAPPSSSPDPSAPQPPAATAPTPAAPDSPVVDTSSTEAPPAAGSLETAAPSADTVVTDTTATEPATTTAPQPTTPKRRPILLPAILILIGVGVLILLFRTKA